MKYIIDRSKWVCGDYESLGGSMLLNNQGRMCCLGQVCKQEGVDDSLMEGRPSPESLNDDTKRMNGEIGWLVVDNLGYQVDSDITFKMMKVNDSKDISQTERELELTRLAATAGHEMVFEGKLML